MIRARVIPCLLLKDGGLVKTVGFDIPKYVGDPINAVRIFNEMEVDELILLDIDAARERRPPAFERIEGIVNEAFMPIAYGGGIGSLPEAQRLVNLGVEKIVVNSALLKDYELLRSMADYLGSQAVVGAVDVKRDWRGRYRVFDARSKQVTKLDVLEHVRSAVAHGAGEIFVNDVLRDGTGRGYDVEMLRQVTATVNVPVIACGGAGSLAHFKEAIAAGASAVAAGSMFVYIGKHRAVMINYPNPTALQETLRSG